jgi:hypothetical protein
MSVRVISKFRNVPKFSQIQERLMLPNSEMHTFSEHKLGYQIQLSGIVLSTDRCLLYTKDELDFISNFHV